MGIITTPAATREGADAQRALKMDRAWMYAVGRIGSTILAAYALGALTGGGELALAIGGVITVALFEVRTLHLRRKQLLSERHPSLDAATVDAAPVDVSPVGELTPPDARRPSARLPNARLHGGEQSGSH